MAERLGLSSHDPLHHFISSAAWDDAPLWRVLAEQVDRQVGGEGAVLVVDDSGLPKKGELSVGVARQYCGELGKVANSQLDFGGFRASQAAYDISSSNRSLIGLGFSAVRGRDRQVG
jgi:SRSO17 transposase